MLSEFKKFDLTDCSIVIPVHIDCPERLEHLQFLTSYFECYFGGYQLIIIEQGTVQKVFHPNVRFIESKRTFSTSEVSNMGAEFVNTSFFCKCDVDAVICPKAIFDAFETLKSTEISMMIPYNGVSFTIQNPKRQEFMKAFDFDALPFVEKKEACRWSGVGMYVKNGDSKGLIHHFKTSVFKQFGGYNEEFVGWGYEDDEIVHRFERLEKPAQYLEGYNAYHLDHPRVPGDPVQAFKNQYRSLAIKKMDPCDILDYIKTWSRFSPPSFS